MKGREKEKQDRQKEKVKLFRPPNLTYQIFEYSPHVAEIICWFAFLEYYDKGLFLSFLGLVHTNLSLASSLFLNLIKEIN